MTPRRLRPRTRVHGFTLAELAVVMLIILLLTGGLIVPLRAQLEARNMADTQRTLTEIRDALLGYAAANGRLPCPAVASSPIGNTAEATTGTEAPSGGGACTNAYNGYVPAITLGITPTDNYGFAVDAWGNRIRYAVTKTQSNAFTTTDGMRTQAMANLTPDLNVCTAAACGTKLSNNAVAVIYSLGKSPTANNSADETENNPADPGDTKFVSHEVVESAGNEFDHQVIWLSPNILYNRMIAAGRLP